MINLQKKSKPDGLAPISSWLIPYALGAVEHWSVVWATPRKSNSSSVLSEVE